MRGKVIVVFSLVFFMGVGVMIAVAVKHGNEGPSMRARPDAQETADSHRALSAGKEEVLKWGTISRKLQRQRDFMSKEDGSNEARNIPSYDPEKQKTALQEIKEQHRTIEAKLKTERDPETRRKLERYKMLLDDMADAVR